MKRLVILGVAAWRKRALTAMAGRQMSKQIKDIDVPDIISAGDLTERPTAPRSSASERRIRRRSEAHGGH
jgi:hypothetical protein